MAAVEAVRTTDLIGRLRRHYIPPQPMKGGVFITECGLNNGLSGNSRCDALYVGFTSASGRMLIGHEIKTSRGDWLRELAQPGKADTWADQCHQWWVVAPDEQVVRRDELPNGWGLMVIDPRSRVRMRIVAKAMTVQVNPDWLIVRSVMARLDTLLREDLYRERETLRREYQAKIEAEMTALRQRSAAGLSVGDPDGQLITQVLTEWRKRRNADWNRPAPTAAAILGAAMDLAGAQEAREQMRQQIGYLISQLERATEPIRDRIPAVRELLKEAGG